MGNDGHQYKKNRTTIEDSHITALQGNHGK